MSDTVIRVEEVGKLYRLGEIGTGTISQDLNRWMARMRGKEDPYAKVGEANDRTAQGMSDYVWALKDINFDVKQGDVLGIIGRNGAGKSTLLKILSKVTAPSTGNIKVKGRIASLLEVGTGFHPELTGRENIFLNGAILGMTKVEIRKKFDEIVDFAGVERYIDTPVKRYSSGMYVRLAFAVAAFLEPEILIVDEVLAVGDAEFQKKCLGRMKDVSVNEGRTVLFVSHNMTAVNSLCKTALLLSKGGVERTGGSRDVVEYYLQSQLKNTLENILNEKVVLPEGEFILEKAEVVLNNELLYIEEEVDLLFYLNFSNEIKNVGFSVSICDESNETLFAQNSKSISFTEGRYVIGFQIPQNILNNNIYTVTLLIVQNVSTALKIIDNILTFEMHEKERNNDYMGKWGGKVRPKANWTISKL